MQRQPAELGARRTVLVFVVVVVVVVVACAAEVRIGLSELFEATCDHRHCLTTDVCNRESVRRCDFGPTGQTYAYYTSSVHVPYVKLN